VIADDKRVTLLGVEIDALTMDETLARCDAVIRDGGYAQHMAINAAKLVTLRDDDRLRAIVNRCELINADGQAVVWASRMLGAPLPERVAGIDLMLRLVELAQERGWPVYFLGAKRDVLETAVAQLRADHPGLQVAGYRDGYFTPDEAGAVCAEIRESGAKILFVAMSTPQKEYFLGEYGPGLEVPFVMGVGGAIDVVAGVARRAPRAWQRLGLEWLYRLLQEPRRMFGRYARTNSRFLWLVARERVGR
jgi:N-acetylglucosaminyldiphosphoundecaprenol N-acetyl-beta-D-mannosaminyltransferase